jgi:hypothetical protein
MLMREANGLVADPMPAGSNLALGRPASGSAACAGNEGPEKAVNGTVLGGNAEKWCSGTAPRQLQVDLGSARTVTGFVVRHAGAGGENTAWNTRDFVIQTSTDGTNWSDAVTVGGNTASITLHRIAARSARYARLGITTPTQTGDGAARIYEFEVYGN